MGACARTCNDPMNDLPSPLTATEEVFWRAFARVLLVLPRALERELQTKANISTSEYVALAHLADSRPDGLRIGELATRIGLSASRGSRLVDVLVDKGQASRGQGIEDGRSHQITITDAGLRRIEVAWPHHVMSVRRYVLDHLAEAGTDLGSLTCALRAILDEQQRKSA
jgi:DNA-binding MarR family transcriptional regulator